MDEKLLNKIALTYIGTPHINGGNIKGAGLDCCTLPSNIFKELLGIDIPIEFGYTGDWFCKKNCKEILLPYLEEHCEKVESASVGTVISYRWGRSEYAHLGLYLGHGKVIHCTANKGVEIDDINAPCFFNKGESRISGFWRLKHESIKEN